MLTNAAHKLNYRVIVLDPTINSPAGQISDKQIIGSFKDRKKILELAKLSDFITFEIEGVNDKTLEEISKKGKPVNPNPKILRTIKDKLKQKIFLANHNIPVAEFAVIETEESAKKQGEIWGYPFILKARFDAYDGRGNYLIKNDNDITNALKKLSGRPLYAEKFVNFKKELAVISARDIFNHVESFAIVETLHKNNICHIVKSPAQVSSAVKIKAKKLARKVLKDLGGVGVFAIEMFLEKNGKVLVNEIAPRVHNSGHHTIEAYNVSQFEQHIRAITGMPVLKPKTKSRAAVMINILGNRNGKAKYKREEKIKIMNAVNIHIYGKMETRKERKMGHITVLGNTPSEAERKARKAHKHISI